MKNWHGFMERDGKFVITELAGFETIEMEYDNPFFAFSLGEVKAETKEEAKLKFIDILKQRIK